MLFKQVHQAGNIQIPILRLTVHRFADFDMGIFGEGDQRFDFSKGVVANDWSSISFRKVL